LSNRLALHLVIVSANPERCQAASVVIGDAKARVSPTDALGKPLHEDFDPDVLSLARIWATLHLANTTLAAWRAIGKQTNQPPCDM
jgi:hypothetical protein